MPTIKPKYNGGSGHEKPKDFSDNLKNELRNFYPEKDVDIDPLWGDPADQFVEDVLSEARYAIAELHFLKNDITSSEIRAECLDLLKYLKGAEKKLRNISVDLERLMDIKTDHLECADQIARFISDLEGISQIKLPRSPNPHDKNSSVALEMTVLVLRVLKEKYGMRISATADDDTRRASESVKILKMIGDDIGLALSQFTWRDIIRKSKFNTEVKT